MSLTAEQQSKVNIAAQQAYDSVGWSSDPYSMARAEDLRAQQIRILTEQYEQQNVIYDKFKNSPTQLDDRVKAQDPSLTPQELITWVNSKPVGNLLDRSAWDKRYNEIGLAQSILFLPVGGRADFGNGREADQIYFYQNLQATDRAILVEMERQKQAGEDYWGGNFLSSPGISDVTKFVTAAAAVAIVAVGTAGLGAAPVAGATAGAGTAGAATGAGTLAGSTGLLTGGTAATTGTGILTSAGLGAGAATTTGVTLGAVGTTGALAGAATLATNYLGTAAAGYLTTQADSLLNPKKEAVQTQNQIANQGSSVSPYTWAALGLGLLFFI